MRHDTFTEKISLWLDDELSPADVAELQTHLAGCPACQQAYQAMQQVDDLFRGAPALMAAPLPGFSGRFETQLAQYHVQRQGQMWLGLGVLFLSTLCFFIVGALLGGVTLVSLSSSWLDLSVLYWGLAEFIESMNALGAWLNLVNLFLRACVITMSQPLFWGYALVAVGMVGLWVYLMKRAYRRGPVTVELFI